MKFPKFRTAILIMAVLTAVDGYGQEQTNGSTLTGGEAVDALKKRGEYDGLRKAMVTAQYGYEHAPDSPDAGAQSGTLIAADGETNDSFGNSVAIDANTAVVGAPFDTIGSNASQGSAYVFVRYGTEWRLQTKLVALDGAPSDNFGICVSISGDTIVVGAQTDDVGAGTDQGSAYVFTRSGTAWTQQSKLTASDGEAGDLFGMSVSVSGDTAVVGAGLDHAGASLDIGAAYVFLRTGNIWQQQAKLVAGDGAVGDTFGISVGISGDTVVVGSYLDNVGANVDQGSAYIFVRTGTAWSQQAKLLASDARANDTFGFRVAISANTVIIGCPGADIAAGGNQGAAYIFARSGSTWSEQSRLVAPVGEPNSQVGYAVSISGDMAVVGAPYADVDGAVDRGAAFVCVRTGTLWFLLNEQKIAAFDGAPGDGFGADVGISGNDIIVGSPADKVGTNSFQGSAQTFRVLNNNWSFEASKTSLDGEENEQMGNSVALWGNTAIIGAPGDGTGGPFGQGAAYVFIRSTTGWTLQTKLLASDGFPGDNFGTGVAVWGDTAVIGAPYADGSGFDGQNQGAAYVFVRSGSTWTQQSKLSPGAGREAHTGWGVAVYDNTVALGSPSANAFGGGLGAVFIYARSGSTWGQQAILTTSDGGCGAFFCTHFGFSVGIWRDTVIVGNDIATATAYVFVRSGAAWSQQAKLVGAGGTALANPGSAVAVSGDTAVVGSSADESSGGSAYVFARGGTLWTQQARITASDGVAGNAFGSSVAISGDAIVVGAVSDTVNGNQSQGSAYVFVRSGTAWRQQQKVTAPGGTVNDVFGRVAIFNDRLLIGAPGSAGVSAPANEDDPISLPSARLQGAAYFFVNAPLTASISGQVLTTVGRGVKGAIVELTRPDGSTIRVASTPRGVFRFDNLLIGQGYVLRVLSRRHVFAPINVDLVGDLSGLQVRPASGQVPSCGGL